MGSVINSILRSYDLFLIDLWGVIWLGAECLPIPESSHFISKLQENGSDFYFLSNTVWPEKRLVDLLEKMDIHIGKEHLITSGRVVSDYISEIVPDYKEKVFRHVGRDWELEAYFSGLSLSDQCNEIDVLITGDFIWKPSDSQPVDFTPVERVLRNNSKCSVIVCNPDIKNLQPDGVWAYQSGSYMMMMEEKYPDHDFTFIGKPHSPIFNYALSLKPEIPKDRICMIGDTVETDMIGAENAGIKKVLVRSGNTAELPAEIEIDHFIEKLI